MRVAVVESNYVTRNHYIFVAIADALRRHAQVDHVDVLDIRTALTHARRDVDLLLVVGGEEADSVVIENLRQGAANSAIWFTEDPYQHPRNLQIAHRFDLVFSNDKQSAKRYGPKGFHLPLASPANDISFVPFIQRRYDLSFIATAWPNRAQLMVDLEPTLRTLKSKILLSGNQFLTPYLASLQMRQPLGSGVDFRDFMRISAQSRLSLFVDRDFTVEPEGRGVSDTPGPRLFETGSAGCCTLVDARVAGDLGQFGLQPWQDYFPFESAMQCRDLIADFKKDQAAFEAAAQSLQTKVLDNHLYDHRVETIMGHFHHLDRKDNHCRVAEGRFAVLFMTHNLPEFSHFGGAELYLQHLLQNLPDVDCYIFSRNVSHGFGKRYVLSDRAGKHLSTFDLERPPDQFTISSTELNDILLKIVQERKINHVFINHLLGFPPAVATLFRHIGLRYSMVLHDYFLTCDSFNLLTQHNRYCGIDRPDFALCRECTSQRLFVDADSQYRRRNIYSSILRHAHVVIVNHLFSWEIIARSLGVNYRGRVEVIAPPLLLDVQVDQDADQESEPDAIVCDQPLRVALIGNLFSNKGSLDFVEIARRCAGLDVVFEVFGKTDPRVAENLRELESVILHGAFDHDSYPAEEVARCDCALFLSQWPETYCMSLLETNVLGLVPIAYGIGAFKERITEQNGYLIEPSVDAAVDVLQSLISNRRALIDKRRAIPPAPSPEQFGRSYRRLFAWLSSARVERVEAAQRADISRWFYEYDASGWQLPKDFWATRRSQDGNQFPKRQAGMLAKSTQHLHWIMGRLNAIRGRMLP